MQIVSIEQEPKGFRVVSSYGDTIFLPETMDNITDLLTRLTA